MQVLRISGDKGKIRELIEEKKRRRKGERRKKRRRKRGIRKRSRRIRRRRLHGESRFFQETW